MSFKDIKNLLIRCQQVYNPFLVKWPEYMVDYWYKLSVPKQFVTKLLQNHKPESIQI